MLLPRILRTVRQGRSWARNLAGQLPTEYEVHPSPAFRQSVAASSAASRVRKEQAVGEAAAPYEVPCKADRGKCDASQCQRNGPSQFITNDCVTSPHLPRAGSPRVLGLRVFTWLITKPRDNLDTLAKPASDTGRAVPTSLQKRGGPAPRLPPTGTYDRFRAFTTAQKRLSACAPGCRVADGALIVKTSTADANTHSASLLGLFWSQCHRSLAKPRAWAFVTRAAPDRCEMTAPGNCQLHARAAGDEESLAVASTPFCLPVGHASCEITPLVDAGLLSPTRPAPGPTSTCPTAVVSNPGLA
ncbi:hypothetical protein Purlil1_8486 [Purpureocillium lilacinum]|uniref:Uncharacterized protein n=1 Tax=Purpureocillium lilacinum TaxID=33203 RepID=A0ABR0BU35_PURLI|nr:hypothetical protein Purlil1_8486 [Purpureocillium lilacinum]